MGCGSSGNVVPAHEEAANGHSKAKNGVQNLHAIAFEIPLEEIDGNRRDTNTPPPHLQRLLQPSQADISLPDIEEKLAEAEQRRLTEHSETNKHLTNAVTISPDPGVYEDKYIT
ncbi:unnamed protein product [Diatraea saccharalis]|uniref:Uncharacterized protein n=1 Tax=Diatraea saccharalis TaxID=40085 RepID=A0A9N9R1I6_9NEOP|nr:unnamed protein product [Diatraea saccharalis]